MPEESRKDHGEKAPFRGASPWLYSVRHYFMDTESAVIKEFAAEDVHFTIENTRQALWLVAKWKSGGGMATRICYDPDQGLEIEDTGEDGQKVVYNATTSIGRYRFIIELIDPRKSLIHFTTYLTPAGELSIPFWPSDTYPIDSKGDPLATEGIIHAAQRGPAMAFMYVSLTEPESGSLLYLQDLTSLNNYCEKTHTVPETRVGGSWPELGYTPPIAERSPLPAGEEVIISDAYIRYSSEIPEDGRRSALQFLEMLSDIYLYLHKPDTTYHHWPSRARGTIMDLTHSAECTTSQGGYRYINAYAGTGDRRPEGLVQFAVLLPLLEHSEWSGEDHPIISELMANLPTFYDHEIMCFIRYPEFTKGQERQEQADEKEHWEVDSWYLYHPLANLARLVRMGHEEAKKLFLDSLNYGVWVARRFEYHWPVLFNAGTLDVMRQGDESGFSGEADVPGLYAYVMLDAWEITGDNCYLEEAIRAADTMEGLRFNIGYQFNNTAWGANAMLRLWKITGEDFYLGLSYVCIASILQNVFMWECNYGYAKHYSTFFGVTPLREGAYIAMYEEVEIFAAFQEYINIMGEDLPECLRILLPEYSRHAHDGKWCYYPSDLPEEILAEKPQNGVINRRLAIPLEDIYQGWEKPGTVGQQVYGAGAALSFTYRSYHRFKDAPFIVYCEYPITDSHYDSGKGSINLKVVGDPRLFCRLRLIPTSGKEMPPVKVRSRIEDTEEDLEGKQVEEGHIDYKVSGSARITIEWAK